MHVTFDRRARHAFLSSILPMRILAVISGIGALFNVTKVFYVLLTMPEQYLQLNAQSSVFTVLLLLGLVGGLLALLAASYSWRYATEITTVASARNLDMLQWSKYHLRIT
jgi:hypothetical protein